MGPGSGHMQNDTVPVSENSGMRCGKDQKISGIIVL